MFEQYLIDHCSPTLARLKTANLFRLPFDRQEDADAFLAPWNALLGERGVELTVLSRDETGMLVYVFRRERLRQDLAAPGVPPFLADYGYSTNPDAALDRLRERFAECGSVPHEIGLFLGYPLGDVTGFIRHKGRNCRYSGCWKVYCNEEETLRAFARFKKCREVYRRLWQDGRSIRKLTVAA
ncbi:MAG: DUF3793 family protein [Ruminococcaceae bacterium]|nr:DUF3793 family protein [Oscillospiraceae bacterium]